MAHGPGDDAQEYLRGASEEIIRCRLYGHAWDPEGPPDEFFVQGQGSDRTLIQSVACMRCGTSAVDHFDPVTLHPIGRSYAYADGYVREAGSGRLARYEVRQWIYRRQRANHRRLRRVG